MTQDKIIDAIEKLKIEVQKEGKLLSTLEGPNGDIEEIRVLYEDAEGRVRVRALIEGLESNRRYYDRFCFDNERDAEAKMRIDIDACYEN